MSKSIGFAFDPDFKNNGFIYVNYNDRDDNTIVSRFENTNNRIDNKTENIILMTW